PGCDPRRIPLDENGPAGGEREPVMLRCRWSSVLLSLVTALAIPVAFGVTLAAPPASAATSWTVVDSPSIPFGEFLDVAGSSRGDVWAVGSWFRASTSAFLSLAYH